MKDATYAHKVLSPKSDLVRGIMRAQYLYVWKGLGTLKVFGFMPLLDIRCCGL